MNAKRSIGVLSVAGKLIKNVGEVVRVKTSAISYAERGWDGRIIQIRELRDGTSQIKRLV